MTVTGVRQLSKEEHRRVRKAIGTEAAEMVADVHRIAEQLARENSALAVELARVRSLQKTDATTLASRCDGASAWCDKNEKSVQSAESKCDERWSASCETHKKAFDRLAALERMTLRQRVRFLLFGVAPWVKVAPAVAAAPDSPFGGEGVEL